MDYHIIIWIIVFLVYSLSTFPSLPGGDSGELLAVSCNNGVARNLKFIFYQLDCYLVY